MELARTVAAERSVVRGVTTEHRLRVRRDAGGEAGKRNCVDDRPHDALPWTRRNTSGSSTCTELDAATDLAAP